MKSKDSLGAKRGKLVEPWNFTHEGRRGAWNSTGWVGFELSWDWVRVWVEFGFGWVWVGFGLGLGWVWVEVALGWVTLSQLNLNSTQRKPYPYPKSTQPFPNPTLAQQNSTQLETDRNPTITSTSKQPQLTNKPNFNPTKLQPSANPTPTRLQPNPTKSDQPTQSQVDTKSQQGVGKGIGKMQEGKRARFSRDFRGKLKLNLDPNQPFPAPSQLNPTQLVQNPIPTQFIRLELSCEILRVWSNVQNDEIILKYIRFYQLMNNILLIKSHFMWLFNNMC